MESAFTLLSAGLLITLLSKGLKAPLWQRILIAMGSVLYLAHVVEIITVFGRGLGLGWYAVFILANCWVIVLLGPNRPGKFEHE